MKKVENLVSFTETGQNDISCKKIDMAVPIWKDYFVDVTGVYRILVEETEEIIYSGNAVPKPGDIDAHVRINDICADYLEHVLPTLDQATFSRMSIPTFVLQKRISVQSDYEWDDVDSVQFFNDWSYDYDFNPETMGLSFPINGIVDARMPIVWTGYDRSEVEAVVYFRDGTSMTIIIPVAISNDFNADFNADFARSAMSAGSGTAVFLPSAWENVARIVIDNVTFNIVDTCSRYALYYINSHGGWDSLLMEGNDMESDSLKRHTREVLYDNRDIQNRGVQNYVNEITKSFTLHTGWLTGNQGKEMHNLINSTQVYMYDMVLEQMIPVTISTTTCEYKTFKNQGNKLVNYTIQVQVAQNRIRR